MSAYTNHLKEDQEIYRGVLAYEQTPTELLPNPDYGKAGGGYQPMYLTVPSGPEETITDIIGPYESVAPIKSYVTRHRGRRKNLRIVRVEKVSGWEEVEI